MVGIVNIGRNARIFSDQCGQHVLKWLDVRVPIEWNLRSNNARYWVTRHDRKHAIVCSGLVRIATLSLISYCQLDEGKQIAWIQLRGTLLVTRGFFPMAFAAIDVAGVCEYFGVIGQRASGNGQFDTSALIVAETVIVVIG